MSKQFLIILWITMASSALFIQSSYAHDNTIGSFGRRPNKPAVDSASARAVVEDIINRVIKASSSFDVNAVNELYTPNAVVADEEPPFSWNGPTAGVQWISTVEKTCKDLKMKNFHAKIRDISVYLQTDESIYVVVPVDYTGQIKTDYFDE